MPTPIPGLHHVTAIASDPQQNLDFYTEALGLRFVKRTVNFDDPGTYHFYFGDDVGSPGTILTFFPWANAARGKTGAGEVVRTAFRVPATSLEYWEERLQSLRIPVERGSQRFGEQVLTLADPDGMKLELVGQDDAGAVQAPRFASVPPEYAIRGFDGVTLSEREAAQTSDILAVLGFRKTGTDSNRLRFEPIQTAALGNHIDLVVDPHAQYGHSGAGSVHHIAFRAADDTAQAEWRSEIAKHLNVTPILDRTYFHSIYFREPGGVLFELATDNPGFLIDEPIQSLGETLRLPPWLEPKRSGIEARIAPIELHKPVPPLAFHDAEGATV